MSLFDFFMHADRALADVRTWQCNDEEISPELERRLDEAEIALCDLVDQLRVDLKRIGIERP